MEHGHDVKPASAESTHRGPEPVQQTSLDPLNQLADFAPEMYSTGQLMRLHAAVGNAAVGTLIGRGSPLIVQRHNPTGVDPEAALASIGGGVGAAPATPVTAPASGGAGAVPAPPLPTEKVDPAAAFKVMQASYGSIATKALTSTKIVALPLADVQAAYAKDCNDRGVQIEDPATHVKRAWTAADASHVGGFYTDLTNTIYVNNDLPILGYVHELLHRNTAAGFDALAGRPINEGTTDHLAVKACKAAGLTNYGPPGYLKEMDVVDQIIAIIGEDKLMQAYFNTPSLLVSAFDAAQGPGWYASLRAAMDKGDNEKIATLTKPATVEDKIARINELFGGFFHFVSDDDIEAIIGIVNSATTAGDRSRLQEAVRAQVTSLTDHGQRARLRAGCDLT